MLKRSSITVFCNESCIYSHRVKIVLAEKGVNFDIVYIDPENPSEDFLDLNPYGSLPTLVDRDLMINQSNITMEYPATPKMKSEKNLDGKANFPDA